MSTAQIDPILDGNYSEAAPLVLHCIDIYLDEHHQFSGSQKRRAALIVKSLASNPDVLTMLDKISDDIEALDLSAITLDDGEIDWDKVDPETEEVLYGHLILELFEEIVGDEECDCDDFQEDNDADYGDRDILIVSHHLNGDVVTENIVDGKPISAVTTAAGVQITKATDQ